MTIEEAEKFIGLEVCAFNFSGKIKRVAEIQRDENNKMIIAELDNGISVNIEILRSRENGKFIDEIMG